MTVHELLHTHSKQIIEEATGSLHRSHLPNYEKAGTKNAHHRIVALYALASRAVQERNVGPMIAHAETIAQERFKQGFDLSEVQTAFNVLEEVMWRYIIKEMSPSDQAEALGLVGTVLGQGKDTLARTYVSLASKSKAPSLNLQSLFAGTAS